MQSDDEILIPSMGIRQRCRILIIHKRLECKTSIYCLLCHPDSCHAHTSSDAHAGHTNSLLCPPQLCEQRADLPRASGSQRVSECNCTSLWIHLFNWQAELLDAVDALACKSLVDLVDVDIRLVDTSLPQSNRDSDGRANAHEKRWHTDDGRAHKFAEDWLVKALRDRKSDV